MYILLIGMFSILIIVELLFFIGFFLYEIIVYGFWDSLEDTFIPFIIIAISFGIYSAILIEAPDELNSIVYGFLGVSG